MNPEPERARDTARRAGFTLLFVSACLGFALELAHAFKLSSYLDVPLRRELLTWSHAHGVGLALVLLAYAANLSHPQSARVARSLILGSLLMPLGFLAASIDLHESDPGLAIALVPLGALCVLRALWMVMRASWEKR